MRNTILALTLLFFSGCATAGSNEPEPGQTVIGEKAVKPHAPSEWRELTSSHFTLLTDHDPKTARKLIESLEELRSGLLAGAWGNAKVEGDHTEVVILQRHRDLEDFATENTGGWTSLLGRRRIVSANGLELEGRRILAHELAHDLSSRLVPNQPIWLAEGLAGYLETIHVREDRVVELGDADVNRFRQVRAQRFPSAGLLEMSRKEFNLDRGDAARFYDTAWLLVHYLNNAQPVGFRRYQVALARGVEPLRAFHETFPELSADRLDHELDVYIHFGQFHLIEAPLPPAGELPIRERELTDADGRAIRASLYLSGPSGRSPAERTRLARAELEPASAAEPTNPRVVEVEAWLADAKAPPVDAARKAVAAHPDDPRAWRVLSNVLEASPLPGAPAERLAALEKAAQLEPNDGVALNNWAWALAQQGQPQAALEPAQRAAKLEPDAFILDTLGVVLAMNGRCDEGRAIEQRAIQLIRPEVAKELTPGYEAHLAQMASCRPAEH